MHRFKYLKAASVAEAATALDAADDGVYLAGGMTLIPTLKQRLAAPTDVIDLGGIDGMAGITVGGRVEIGALTRHTDVATSPAVRGVVPALADLAGLIGDAHVRNRGTLGGSIANNDPAADYPAAVLALNAVVYTDRREIAADDFFKGLFETALKPGEIVKSLAFRIPRRAAYAKFPNPASRYAIVGVMVADFGDQVRVGVTGAGPCAFRSAELEGVLAGGPDGAALADVMIPHAGFNTDIHASAEYRGHLVAVMARRAVAQLG